MTDLRNEGTAWAAAAAAYIHDPHLFHAEDGALLEAEVTSTDLGFQGGKCESSHPNMDIRRRTRPVTDVLCALLRQDRLFHVGSWWEDEAEPGIRSCVL